MLICQKAYKLTERLTLRGSGRKNLLLQGDNAFQFLLGFTILLTWDVTMSIYWSNPLMHHSVNSKQKALSKSCLAAFLQYYLFSLVHCIGHICCSKMKAALCEGPIIHARSTDLFWKTLNTLLSLSMMRSNCSPCFAERWCSQAIWAAEAVLLWGG